MNEKYNDFSYVFHSTREYSDLILFHIKNNNLSNCEVINDSKIKNHILKKSVFAVSKSGTISLEICKAKIPSVILYKMGLINFFIIKMLVKTKFANIINIAAKKEIIPELLQSNCNPKKIFEVVSNYLDNPKKIDEQVSNTQTILKSFKTNTLSSTLAANVINKYL
jgi:lipid-A-disaccharide synthase